MKIQIKVLSHQDYIDELTARNMPLGTHIPSFLRTVIDEGYQDGISTVSIQLHPDLLAKSYIANPALLAQAINAMTYPNTKSHYHDGFMTVTASSRPIPSTFREKVRNDLKKKGLSKRPRKSVPKSYRGRPSILAGILTRELGRPISAEIEYKTITWIDRDYANRKRNRHAGTGALRGSSSTSTQTERHAILLRRHHRKPRTNHSEHSLGLPLAR